ncbi:MAG: hypothetical protein ACI8QD_002706, partial [Cyclobacteriaceae bacterium]
MKNPTGQNYLVMLKVSLGLRDSKSRSYRVFPVT